MELLRDTGVATTLLVFSKYWSRHSTRSSAMNGRSGFARDARLIGEMFECWDSKMRPTSTRDAMPLRASDVRGHG